MTVNPFLVIDVIGVCLTAEDYGLLQHPFVEGVVLFSRNVASVRQLKNLVSQIKCIPRKGSKPLTIYVDQEGGCVQRIKEPLLVSLPACRELGRLWDIDPLAAMRLAKQQGHQMASGVKSLGIDVSFAPVLDLDFSQSDIIGSRSFHEDAAVVAALSANYIRGMRAAGLSAVGKHFPGHGFAVADSHVDMPVDTRNARQIWDEDLQPYQYLIDQKLLWGVMSAHISYPKCDSQIATYSTYWLKNILKGRMGYQGLIFSDCLSMKGSGDEVITTRVRKALEAGVDRVLLCNDREAVELVLDCSRKE